MNLTGKLMKTTQRTLRFSLTRRHGQLVVNHKASEAALNHSRNLEIPTTKNYCPKAALLKRIARRVMVDITDCPPDTIPAHLARLEDLRDIFHHELTYTFDGTPEGRFSGKQLATPHTLKDFLECLNITRKDHRAPAFVNQRDEDIAQIKNMISTLAGLVAQNPEALELFQRQFNEAQTEVDA